MSRRARKIVKRVSLDPKYNSELVAHMIRVIMKDGKKTVAEKIVYGAIDKIKAALEADPAKFKKEDKEFTDPLEVVSAAIENMKPQVEVKTRRVGGTTYPVPVPIAPNRQLIHVPEHTPQFVQLRYIQLNHIHSVLFAHGQMNRENSQHVHPVHRFASAFKIALDDNMGIAVCGRQLPHLRGILIIDDLNGFIQRRGIGILHGIHMGEDTEG